MRGPNLKIKKRREEELIGKKIGKLLVIGPVFHGRCGLQVYCRCECGKITYPRISALKRSLQSCLDCSRLPNEKLSHIPTEDIRRLSIVLAQMRRRCNSKKGIYYEYYGKRGIKVCFESSLEFCLWAFSNGYKKGLTIDRINNDGDYEPNNCRWVTMKEQSLNKRNSLKIIYKNATYSLLEFVKIYFPTAKFPYNVYKLLKRFTPEEAIEYFHRKGLT